MTDSSAPDSTSAQQLDPLRGNLETHLAEITRKRDPFFSPLGHLYVQTYIEAELNQWGEVYHEEFEYSGRVHCNLYLDLPGQTPKAQLPQAQAIAPILIGAHYDAVHGSPGADDNATGIAALLELARTFAAAPAPRPLRLVAFDAEEYGRVGSIFSARLAAQNGQALRLMLALEMLGYCSQAPQSQSYPAPWLERLYPNTGNFIALVGNLQTLPDLWRWRRCFQRYGIPASILPIWNQGTPLPRTRDSDHSAFWDKGYNAVMVTDTADLRNPNYHKSSDRIETLDLDFFTRVTQGLIACLHTVR